MKGGRIMTRNLNENLGETKPDALIYDFTRPLDGRVVEVEITAGGKGGTLERGQVLDLKDGSYTVHAEGGTANVIVSESTEYSGEDAVVSVPVYISGSFRQSALVSGAELSAGDIEQLRGVGIIVK